MKYLVIDDFISQSYLSMARMDMRRWEMDMSYNGYNNSPRLRDSLDPRYAATTYITDRTSILQAIWATKEWRAVEKLMAESEDSALVHASMTGYGSTLLSAYGNGDYYGQHIDINLDCVATAVLMLTLKEPQQFSGGAFLLGDEKIEFKNNRLIVFPSCRLHGVEPVELEDNAYENRRFTLQYFISAVPYKGRFADEGNYKQ